MSQSSSENNQPNAAVNRPRKWWLVILLPAWVVASFYIAQLLVAFSIVGLQLIGLNVQLGSSEAVENTVFAAIIYLLTIAIVVGVPYLLKKTTSREVLGLTKLPTWTDLMLAPAGFVVYFIGSALLLYLVAWLLPSVDLNQVQDTGFNNISFQYEYVLAFVTLVIIAPIAEELLFRGYLYGQLKRVVPMWAAVVITSGLFGAIHGSWNVALDTFALGVVLCVLREISGTIYPAIFLHMLKNGIAYYLLFINTSIIGTMG